MKKKTKEDIWIVTDEEKLPINPIEWCLCAWVCGPCDMRAKKKKSNKIRKYDDVIIREPGHHGVVFLDL